jgi:hypothetical protein
MGVNNTRIRKIKGLLHDSFGLEVARGPNVELIGLTLVPRSE